MIDLLGVTLAQALQNSWLELLAVVLGVAYLLLAMRENILCWYAAFFSTAIFLSVFWEVKLYMESGLQVYYLAMAVYGWYQWRKSPDKGDSLAISTWTTQRHLTVILITLCISAISGYGLANYTDANFPYLDSVTTWGAIVTTYMVARKVLENWIYWFVLDALSIYLYIDRGLYFTALLFAAYLVIVIFGYLTWRRRYYQQILS
ncbi:MAG: nicotinamide mononucleotide transporter [Candidatus Azotimanducaceae bacterium]|jgi:nicotinamide mononucleotide transporter